MGILNAINYESTAATDLTGQFIIGCDFESYSGKSGALLSGVSTLGTDLVFSGTYTALPAAALFDFFLHYDMKLIIKDGVMTIHV